MENLINSLLLTNSGNEKIEILKQYCHDEKIKEAFRLCYDPFEISNISKFKKLDIGDQSSKHNFHESFDDFKEIFLQLKNREITGNLAKDIVHLFLDRCKTETQEIYKCILNKSMKCGVSVATLSKIYGADFLRRFEIQLANKYNPEKNYGVDYWYINTKLDGLRFFYKDNELFTRSGKPIFGFEFIKDELAEIQENFDLTFIDGELYSHELDFQTIQGYVLSYRNINEDHKKKIIANVFAVGRDDFKNTQDMIDVLKRITWYKVNHNCCSHVKTLNTFKVKNDFEEINRITKKYIKEGFEGSMLRHPENWYSYNRSDNLLKFKLFKEEDFKLVGFDKGSGKNKERLGAIFVEGVVESKKIKSRVGTGLSDEQRDHFWNNQNVYINKLVEVKYQGITDKPDQDGFYSLRFPVFIKTKEDR